MRANWGWPSHLFPLHLQRRRQQPATLTSHEGANDPTCSYRSVTNAARPVQEKLDGGQDHRAGPPSDCLQTDRIDGARACVCSCSLSLPSGKSLSDNHHGMMDAILLFVVLLFCPGEGRWATAGCNDYKSAHQRFLCSSNCSLALSSGLENRGKQVVQCQSRHQPCKVFVRAPRVHKLLHVPRQIASTHCNSSCAYQLYEQVHAHALCMGKPARRRLRRCRPHRRLRSQGYHLGLEAYTHSS